MNVTSGAVLQELARKRLPAATGISLKETESWTVGLKVEGMTGDGRREADEREERRAAGSIAAMASMRAQFVFQASWGNNVEFIVQSTSTAPIVEVVAGWY